MKECSDRSQRYLITLVGWVIGIVGVVVYALTMAPTASLWDCGEFITTSYTLQVGHPPGAPFYQLVAHCFTLLAGGDMSQVAWWSNMLSVVSGGLTPMFLFWILVRFFTDGESPESQHFSWMRVLGAAVGALCFLFCDTAWFSAVESEVYAFAVFLCSVQVWVAVRWWQCQKASHFRWLLLEALLTGLGVCVHWGCLLVFPAVLLLVVLRGVKHREDASWRTSGILVAGCLLFFVIGLSPYLIIPIRAAGNPPINQGNPDNYERFCAYIGRKQYAKAPIYPRLWRRGPNDVEYQAVWSGGGDDFAANVRFYASYQMGYMYLRYLMWNFSGRYNDRQGYGSLHNGQFVTGIPLVDRFFLGTGKVPPLSLHGGGRQVYFLLPFLLGLVGVFVQHRRSKVFFWVTMLVFLFGGLFLNIFLNHPTYEPRERDYIYVVSFFAFAVWIGEGAFASLSWMWEKTNFILRKYHILCKISRFGTVFVMLFIPCLMAAENWESHDRSHNYLASDVARGFLESCDSGAMLFTAGDNDTFPLWFAHYVEGVRPDVECYNINLLGDYRVFLNLLEKGWGQGSVFVTHYAYDFLKDLYPNRFRQEGMIYRFLPDEVKDTLPLYGFQKLMAFHPQQSGEGHLDETSLRFVDQYWQDVISTSQLLLNCGYAAQADTLLRKTIAEADPLRIYNPETIASVALCFQSVANSVEALAPVSQELTSRVKNEMHSQLEYFDALSASNQRFLQYTIKQRKMVLDTLQR